MEEEIICCLKGIEIIDLYYSTVCNSNESISIFCQRLSRIKKPTSQEINSAVPQGVVVVKPWKHEIEEQPNFIKQEVNDTMLLSRIGAMQEFWREQRL